MARSPSVLMVADKEVAPSIACSRLSLQAVAVWHGIHSGAVRAVRGPSVRRWAATSHRACCTVRPPATRATAPHKESQLYVWPVSQWLGGDEMHARRSQRLAQAGAQRWVAERGDVQQVDRESITTRATPVKSTQVRQIDVWVTTEDPRGPRQVRLWWSLLARQDEM
jgi:hypothetical protein